MKPTITVHTVRAAQPPRAAPSADPWPTLPANTTVYGHMRDKWWGRLGPYFVCTETNHWRVYRIVQDLLNDTARSVTDEWLYQSYQAHQR